MLNVYTIIISDIPEQIIQDPSFLFLSLTLELDSRLETACSQP